MSFGLLVPFREPFGTLVAALPLIPAVPTSPPTIAVGATVTELELELVKAVDDGNGDEDALEDFDESPRLLLELDDGLSKEDDWREDPEDAPAALTVALFPVIALMTAGKGPDVEALMLTTGRIRFRAKMT